MFALKKKWKKKVKAKKIYVNISEKLTSDEKNRPKTAKNEEKRQKWTIYGRKNDYM